MTELEIRNLVTRFVGELTTLVEGRAEERATSRVRDAVMAALNAPSVAPPSADLPSGLTTPWSAPPRRAIADNPGVADRIPRRGFGGRPRMATKKKNGAASYLTPVECVRRSRRSLSTIYRWMRDGTLAVRKIGGNSRVSEASLRNVWPIAVIKEHAPAALYRGKKLPGGRTKYATIAGATRRVRAASVAARKSAKG